MQFIKDWLIAKQKEMLEREQEIMTQVEKGAGG
jgi:hypothetical protein